jgi:nucleoside-diphosphate-sugar epimerase
MRGARPLLLPIRTITGASECIARIRLALLDCGAEAEALEALLQRVHVVALPAPDKFGALDTVVAAMDVAEIVHCAGCTDYFDGRRLHAANVALTADLLNAGRRWGVQRFIYISTAYCSGFRSGTIPERLHPDPASSDEPTDYTRTKRMAERLVAGSGLPFVIIRPSIVIGDSRSGIYRGKNYGLYQIWRAWEALLGPEYSPVWYTVSPAAPLNLLHQDAFQAGFLAIHRAMESDRIVHLVADDAKSPTMRDVCWLWAEVYCPTEIRSYAVVDDVPLHSLPTRQRRFLELSAKNLEIAAHRWRFETAHLDVLRAGGLVLADATIESVARCQQRYIAQAPRILAHMRSCAFRADQRPRFVAVPLGTGAQRAPPAACHPTRGREAIRDA